ncbi:Oxysterol-binding protein-related protein 1 [Cricetulus griseus]|uniref:Oxysterol-binding protein-related protein 1 n=1 Tax=Cricetulus griseus TaxID=10029 RepID=G3HT54_CRIGR|nr:Oxysterol-binding protein-related protein 1 [Cricetulus griseus]
MVVGVFVALSLGFVVKKQQDMVRFLEANKIEFEEVDITMSEEQNQKPLDLAHGAEMKHLLVGNKVKPTDSCLFSIRCFDDTVHGFRVPKNSLQQSREDQVTDEEEEDAVSPMDLKESLKCMGTEPSSPCPPWIVFLPYGNRAVQSILFSP